MTTKNESILLFKKVKPEQPTSIFRAFFSDPAGHEEVKEELQEVLWFVSEITTAKQLAELVRIEPTAKYVLFRGSMVDVDIRMPVFIDGRNIELHNEWI